MLIGEYQHNLDAKGRLIMPARFREDLGTRCVVSRSFDGNCLFVYPSAEWKKLTDSISQQPTAQILQFQRYFIATASEQELDAQGRLLIPAPLRQFANLTRDVVVLGVSTRLEIWDKQRWDELQESMNPSEMMEILTRLGF